VTDITLNRVFRAALRGATVATFAIRIHTRPYRINYHFYIHLFSEFPLISTGFIPSPAKWERERKKERGRIWIPN